MWPVRKGSVYLFEYLLPLQSIVRYMVDRVTPAPSQNLYYYGPSYRELTDPIFHTYTQLAPILLLSALES